MSTPDVFVRAAAAVGEQLVAAAISHQGQCTWLTHDIDEDADQPTVVETSCGPDLYQGTAGIGWALAHVAALTDDSAAATTAAGALRHAIAHAPDDLSLHGGRAGIAYAAIEGGGVLGDEPLTDTGYAIARALARRVCGRGGDGDIAWDLMGGQAGVALSLAALPGNDGVLLEAAHTAAQRVVHRAEVDDVGWRWPSQGTAEPGLCGLGHGAVGAALALATVAQRTGTDEFGTAIAGALRYERAWLDPAAGWPDLRGLTRLSVHSGGHPTYPVHWCHGAAGAGIARARLADLLAPSQESRALLLAEAGAAIDRATTEALRSLAPDPLARPWLANVSVCHGIGSIAELHLAAHDITGDGEHLRHARQLILGALAVPPEDLSRWEQGRVTDQEMRAALTDVSCGIPGAPAVPGLMVGTAGLLALLLRLADRQHIRPIGLPQARGEGKTAASN
jgi:lantibiotic biosynthesis protein